MGGICRSIMRQLFEEIGKWERNVVQCFSRSRQIDFPPSYRRSIRFVLSEHNRKCFKSSIVAYIYEFQVRGGFHFEINNFLNFNLK